MNHEVISERDNLQQMFKNTGKDREICLVFLDLEKRIEISGTEKRGEKKYKQQAESNMCIQKTKKFIEQGNTESEFFYVLDGL